MSQNQYAIHVAPTDLWAALECEARRAASEDMMLTAERQHETALHLKNATYVMAGICPDDHRVQVRIVLDFVPDVNPSYQGA